MRSDRYTKSNRIVEGLGRATNCEEAIRRHAGRREEKMKINVEKERRRFSPLFSSSLVLSVSVPCACIRYS